MPRFFVQATAITTGEDGVSRVTVSGSDADHITRSLRMHPGDSLTVCDMSRREYLCEIESVGASVTAKVLSETASLSEPPYTAVLYQALVKGDKFDTVVQKAVECGVSVIVPVLTERCTVRPDEKGLRNKLVRWRRIAAEAAGQCGRGILPVITEPMDFADAVKDAQNAALAFFCYEGEDAFSLKDLASRYKECPKSIAFFVGSEGGICQKEVDMLQNAGLYSVGLGKRILRCESAPLFVLSCLSYIWEM